MSGFRITEPPMERYLQSAIREDIEEKMVFIGGPRQVGKTTLSLDFLDKPSLSHPAYLNWDIVTAKNLLLNGELPGNEPIIILDEIHKYKDWRNLVKGYFDRYRDEKKFLITGSAKLDYYRRGGDSLQGRYYYHRLHPFSLAEVSRRPNAGDVESLLTFGGFPEPFLKGNIRTLKRWQRERQARIIQEDLISLESVKDISTLDLLVQTLPDRVGSILSVNSLRRDLSIAFETAERWIQILENLYHCYRILPFGSPGIRAAKKEKKLYMWDWSLCRNNGARFENMVASHLLKYCHFLEDTEGENMELRFLRDHDGREVDFVVLKNNHPEFAVECKTGDKSISRHISYFAQRTDIPIFYQVHLEERDYEHADSKARVLPFRKFCQEVNLPRDAS